MPWTDTESGYGWLSIVLHWIVAGVILTLWGIGDWMQGVSTLGSSELREYHISIAACTWLLIIARIVWRIRSSHPKLDGQTNFTHQLAKGMHYLLLFSIAMMVVSGPAMLWTAGLPIEIFELISIPSPISPMQSINPIAVATHKFFANAVMILILIHIAGAFKHLMFNDDDTFISMLIAAKSKSLIEQSDSSN